jgi:hypothetical protein
MFVGPCKDSANTASAALMNGWINSILMSGVLLRTPPVRRRRWDRR